MVVVWSGIGTLLSVGKFIQRGLCAATGSRSLVRLDLGVMELWLPLV
jgi:hypothetical protein